MAKGDMIQVVDLQYEVIQEHKDVSREKTIEIIDALILLGYKFVVVGTHNKGGYERFNIYQVRIVDDERSV